ncbi:hypothetical protein [Vibrio nigripulchritudo]|uniref:hypothetical protein n=1 Tax=Vibrio nigripulchritudo TaxID=28173 RepID=UPI0011AE1CBC|nr:hypothetical protein [Vibrio nigripulchritudo]
MKRQIKIQETTTTIEIIVNEQAFMTFDKSKFESRERAINFAEDILGLFNVGVAIGETTGLLTFVNGLSEGSHSKTDLESRARTTLETKYGDAINF